MSKQVKAAILCTGDELLKGTVLNTNLAFLGKNLLETGIIPSFAMEIPDSADAILAALDQALNRVDLVIVSGGLGPTADDLTKESIARHLGFRLEEDGEVLLNIKRYWKQRHPGEEIHPRIFNQALVPHGAQVLHNHYGTAPGLILKTQAGKTVILLPGPPGELEPMFTESILPILRNMIPDPVHARVFLIAGIGESTVEDRMLPVLARHNELSAAYCATAQFVRLFLTSHDCESLGSAISEVRNIFRDELLSDEANSLPEEILLLLRARGETLATAESCTGGLISKWITDLPGASDVFQGTVVSYANEVKMNLLQVPEETLKRVGAVSRETAEAMVRGAQKLFHTDAVISITGIAGPGGGTPEKPVGLVYAGILYHDKVEIHELHLRRSREQIRERAAAEALNRLRLLIRKSEFE